MRAIGIRAVSGDPDSIHWAIVEGDKTAPILVAHEQSKVPANLGEADGLAWLRKRILHLVNHYKVTALAIKIPERNARANNYDGPKRRLRMEGVAMEAAASLSLPVQTSALPDVAAQLGTDKKNPKKYLATETLRGLDWGPLGSDQREAVLVAVGALGPGAAAAGTPTP